MNKKECFIQEIEKQMEENKIILSQDSLDFFATLKEKTELTENGKRILKYLQEKTAEGINTFTSKTIGEGLEISSRSVSGTIRKLVTDNYVQRNATSPISYTLTELGQSYSIDIL